MKQQYLREISATEIKPTLLDIHLWQWNVKQEVAESLSCWISGAYKSWDIIEVLIAYTSTRTKPPTVNDAFHGLPISARKPC